MQMQPVRPPTAIYHDMMADAGVDRQTILITKKITGRVLGFSRAKVERLLAAGELQGFREGGRVRVTVASIRAYLQRKLGEPDASETATVL